MKDIFAVDLHTHASKSSSIIERELDKNIIQKQEDYTNHLNELEKKAQLPTLLSLLRTVLLVLASVFLGIFFMELTQMGEGQKIPPERYILFGFGCLFLIIGSCLTIYKKKRAKKVAASEEYKNLLKSGDQIAKESDKFLKIPQSATPIDVFLYVYSTKGGKERPATRAFDYINASVKIFTEGEKVMLADMQTVFAVEKAWFKGFEIIEKRIVFNAWNKAKYITDKPYSNFAVKQRSNGSFSVKNAVKINFERAGEQFFIIVPPYDSEIFLKYIGSKKKKG